MSSTAQRSTWTTDTIRAADLDDSDTVLINGVWREIFDVWRDGDDPAAQFGDDSPTTRAILDKTEWGYHCWIAVRYVDEDRSNASEIADSLHFFRLRDLVQVQHENKTPAGFRPADDGLAGPLSLLGPLGVLGGLRSAVELYGEHGDPNDDLSATQVDQLRTLAEYFNQH